MNAREVERDRGVWLVIGNERPNVLGDRRPQDIVATCDDVPHDLPCKVGRAVGGGDKSNAVRRMDHRRERYLLDECWCCHGDLQGRTVVSLSMVLLLAFSS